MFTYNASSAIGVARMTVTRYICEGEPKGSSESFRETPSPHNYDGFLFGRSEVTR